MLRDYQQTAVDSILAELAAGKARVLLVSPTGSGKSVIAQHLIERGGRVLFVVHRREIIEQTSKRFAHIPHGVIMAGHPRTDHSVQLASIQTLNRRHMPAADLIIIDEAHHSQSISYRDLFDVGAPIVGLTATPFRLDGKGLGEWFDSLVVAAKPRELMDAGHLCRYTGFEYVTADLTDIKIVNGDFDTRSLSMAMSTKTILGNVVEQWVKHCAGSRTIVFAVDIEHSMRLCAEFQSVGVKAEHLDFKTPLAERSAILERLRSGETRVLCNVTILTEGVDIPDLETALLCRPTMSTSLYLQMVGRIMRPAPGKALARIHDHSKLLRRHGLPEQDRDYSLQKDRDKVAKDLTAAEELPLHTCAQCYAIFEGDVCPNCGAERVKKVTKLVVENAVARPIGQGSPRDMFRAWMLEARAMGRKPGYVVHRYKEKFPQEPMPWGIWRELVGKDKQWLKAL
jgi:superfamily II DNA or RNA helicase